MISAADDFNLKFTALSIDREVQLDMPMWKHPSVRREAYKNTCLRDAATCLRINHDVRTVRDALTIATRKTTVARRPHTVNPSGIGRKNCGCPPCNRDRNELDCPNPGKCVDTAKTLIDCIMPKWNPSIPVPDLCNDINLTAEELHANQHEIKADEEMMYDPNFRLLTANKGFRIF
ncbi:hypothetical protein DFH06DRAFT_979163, partial [Mycena polygramma]